MRSFSSYLHCALCSIEPLPRLLPPKKQKRPFVIFTTLSFFFHTLLRPVVTVLFFFEPVNRYNGTRVFGQNCGIVLVPCIAVQVRRCKLIYFSFPRFCKNTIISSCHLSIVVLAPGMDIVSPALADGCVSALLWHTCVPSSAPCASGPKCLRSELKNCHSNKYLLTETLYCYTCSFAFKIAPAK